MTKNNAKIFFIFLFFILILSFSWFGMKYFPIADDNSQIGAYHFRSNNIYENVIMYYNAYNVRPFAFLTDAYIFSLFWDNLYALMMFIVILHVLNVYLLYKICMKIDIKLNIFCLTVFTLSPILIEALYWISAATRIVLSLFLILSSIYLLLLSFDEKNKSIKLIEFLGSIIINLISVGFYEQTITLNLFLFCFVLIILKKYKYIFIPITSTLWIVIYYMYFMILGKIQGRGILYLTSIFSNTKDCILLIIRRFGGVVYKVLNLLPSGIRIAFENPILLIITIALISVLCFYIFKKEYQSGKTNKRKIWFAIIMIVTPFLPFIVLKADLAYRNLYLSFFGICVILEIMFETVFKNTIFIKVVITILIVASTFTNISMINNYRIINELDNKIAINFLNAVDDDIIEKQKSISIIYNKEDLYKLKGSARYLLCSVEVDWAMRGKIQVAREKGGVGKVYINSNQEESDCVVYFDENMKVKNVTYKGAVN